MKVIKNCDRPVTACCLGEYSALERRLLDEGKLRRREDGGYEVFSQEASGGRGERAEAGDFVKVDSALCPYPNKRSFFLQHHEKRAGDWYQIPEPLEAWDRTMPLPEEIRFLLDTGRLEMDESDPAHCFRAMLWGAPLSAAADAVILYNEIRRRPDGSIEDLSFRFVARDEFEKTYRSLITD